MRFRVKKYEIVYFFAYFLMCFSNIVMNSSYVSTLLPEGSNTVVRYSSMAVFLISLLIRRWPPKRIILLLVGWLLVLYIALRVDKPFIVLYGLAIVGINGVDFKKLCRVVPVFQLVSLGIVLFCCLMGYIPNEVYVRGTRVSYALGFGYYSSGSITLFSASTLLLLKERRRYRGLLTMVLLIIANYVMFCYTTTRLMFYLFLIESALWLYYCFLWRKPLVDNRFTRLAALSMHIVAIAVLFTVSIRYSASVPWMRALNSFLNGRINYNNIGLLRYGISVFGQKVATVSQYINTFNIVAEEQYFYVDSGYVYAFLEYGIIMFAAAVVGYSFLQHYAIRYDRRDLWVWGIVVCIYSVINNIFISFELNPLLLLVPSAIAQIRQDRQEALEDEDDEDDEDDMEDEEDEEEPEE